MPRNPKPISNPDIKVVGDRKLFHATPAQMADPEWRVYFAIHYPGVELVENRPIMVGRPT